MKMSLTWQYVSGAIPNSGSQNKRMTNDEKDATERCILKKDAHRYKRIHRRSPRFTNEPSANTQPCWIVFWSSNIEKISEISDPGVRAFAAERPDRARGGILLKFV